MKGIVQLLAWALITVSTALAQTLPGPAFTISTENLDPDMQLVAAGARSSFAVAYEDLATNLRLRFLRADGVPLSDTTIIGYADDVSIASDGDGFLLVYSELQEVRAIRFSGAGERLDAEPILISAVTSAPPVHVVAIGRGSWRVFWAEGMTVRTALLRGGELSESSPVVAYAEKLIDIQAQMHPISEIWLITVTTEVPCRITCVPVYSSTLYASLLPGTAVDIGELEDGGAPKVLVLRDGRIAAAASTGAIGWQFEGSELIPQWLIEHNPASCDSSLVEHGSQTLSFTVNCESDVLFLQPVSARGAVGVRLPVDAAVDGFPIATFRTLRGAGVVYVGDPANPTLVGRVMPSLYRRGIKSP